MEIEIEFISAEILSPMGSEEKLKYIIKRVKKDKIIVVEESLSSLEEARLIEETMKQVSSRFPGIEVSTLRENTGEGLRERLIRFLGGKTGGLTVIGPSKLVKRVKKEPSRISIFAEK